MRGDKVGFQLRACQTAGLGQPKLAERAMHFGQVLMKARLATVERDRALDRFQRHGELPAGVGHQSQQVPGVGIAGVGFKHLAVQALGLCQVAGPMTGDGRVENFGDG